MILLIAILNFLFSSPVQNFESELSKYITSKLPEYVKVNYQVLSSPKFGKNEEMIIDSSRKFKRNGNIGYVPVNVKSKNSSLQSVITLRLQLYKNAFSAACSFKKGDELTAEKFQSQLTDISQIRGTIITDLSDLNKYRVKKSLAQGSILIKEYLEADPIINKGDKVTAYIETGSVVVSVDAVAMENGIQEQTIRVLTGDKKYFRAKVLDNYSLKIIE